MYGTPDPPYILYVARLLRASCMYVHTVYACISTIHPCMGVCTSTQTYSPLSIFSRVLSAGFSLAFLQSAMVLELPFLSLHRILSASFLSTLLAIVLGINIRPPPQPFHPSSSRLQDEMSRFEIARRYPGWRHSDLSHLSHLPLINHASWMGMRPPSRMVLINKQY